MYEPLEACLSIVTIATQERIEELNTKKKYAVEPAAQPAREITNRRVQRYKTMPSRRESSYDNGNAVINTDHSNTTAPEGEEASKSRS